MSRNLHTSAPVAVAAAPQPGPDLQTLWLWMLAATLAGALLATFALEGM